MCICVREFVGGCLGVRGEREKGRERKRERERERQRAICGKRWFFR